MDGATPGWIGGAVSAGVGAAGGGTRASLKRARAPEERLPVVRFAGGLPCALFVALGPVIAWVNRRGPAPGRRSGAGDRSPDGRP